MFNELGINVFLMSSSMMYMCISSSGVHPLQVTTSSSSSLNVSLTEAVEANA